MELKHLTKRFSKESKPVLADINIVFPKTGLCYLIGKSGSGKTTLLKLLGTLDTDYEGMILYEGRDLKSLSEEERENLRYSDFSFVFQDFCALEEETVKENLLPVLALSSLSKQEKQERIKYYLRKVGLEEKENQCFGDLSGGEKKRISLVRGLLKPTPVLLVDEPVSALDQQRKIAITSLLQEEANKRLVIVITHETSLIPKECQVYELVNGRLEVVKETSREDKKVPLPMLGRVFYPLSSQLRSAYRFFHSNFRFLSIVFFSLTLALFSSTFSFQLSTTISDSIQESFSSMMDENTMVVENKSSALLREGYESVSYQDRLYYLNRYPDYVLSVSDFYTESGNTFFQGNQSFRICLEKKQLSMPKLSLDSFLSFSLPQEAEVVLPSSYAEDEIALLLDEDSFFGFYYLLYGESAKEITASEVSRCNDILSYRNVFVEMNLNRADWGYHLNHSFRIRNVFLGDTVLIVSPQEEFADHLVKEILHFKTRYIEDDSVFPPWTFSRVTGLRLKKGKLIDFLMLFLKDNVSDEYTVELLRPFSYYLEKEEKTHNRIALFRDCHRRLSVSSFQKVKDSHHDILSGLRFSSSFYTYTASGYISGFLHPFFFSRYKDKLNRIEDNNHSSKEDMGSFQGSLIQVEDNVYPSDLLSSMEGKSVLFSSVEDSNPLYGTAPSHSKEVGISLTFAKELFREPEAALNQTLYVLSISKTTKEGDHYKNEFSQESLTISAIYQGEDLLIYQDPLFPFCFAFSLSEGHKEDFLLDQVLMNVSENIKEEEASSLFPNEDYRLSFPMKEMIREVKKTIRFLSVLFLGLSLFSFLSSGFVMGLSFFLVLKKNRKNIGVLLSLGYHRKEISCYYFLLLLLLCFSGYLSSLLFSSVTEKIILDTLSISFSFSKGSMIPYLISLFSCLVLALSVFLVLRLWLKKISPKDALKSSLL